MGRRLVPAYVARPAWQVVEARDRYFDDMGTLEEVIDAIIELERGLLRDQSTLLDAPDYVLRRELEKHDA